MREPAEACSLDKRKIENSSADDDPHSFPETPLAARIVTPSRHRIQVRSAESTAIRLGMTLSGNRRQRTWSAAIGPANKFLGLGPKGLAAIIYAAPQGLTTPHPKPCVTSVPHRQTQNRVSSPGAQGCEINQA